MKSSLSCYKRHEGIYKTNIFKAVDELGFRYYTSATEFVVLWYNGQWTPYEVVQKKVKGLPEIEYA